MQKKKMCLIETEQHEERQTGVKTMMARAVEFGTPRKCLTRTSRWHAQPNSPARRLGYPLTLVLEEPDPSRVSSGHFNLPATYNLRPVVNINHSPLIRQRVLPAPSVPDTTFTHGVRPPRTL